MERSAKDISKLSSDEQLEMLAQLNASTDNNPEVDLWSLNADLLGQWPEIMLYWCLGFDP